MDPDPRIYQCEYLEHRVADHEDESDVLEEKQDGQNALEDE